MKLNLSVDEVLSTTRAVRKRLDVNKPVPRALIDECLELAFQAPNGMNQNTWRWIVVDAPATPCLAPFTNLLLRSTRRP